MTRTVTARHALYRTIWRWHFYAGLFVVPFILILSATGAVYLFKPQLDRWEERHWHGATVAAPASPDAIVDAALAGVKGSSLNSYRLPEAAGEAVRVHLALADGTMRDAYVAPDGRLLAVTDPDDRISEWARRIHGTLLIGRTGSLLVELAASWAIVMILTGLYLWWPRGRRLAGVVWPRLDARGRPFWRDLHAVTGFWVAGLAMVMLLSGLPWTDAWAKGFRWVRAEMGWVSTGPANWKGGGDEHASHDHAAMMAEQRAAGRGSMTLSQMVEMARLEPMPAPAILQPPHAARPFGPPTGNVWTLTSESRNLPAVRTVTYDPDSGAVVGREGFADKHPVDRAVNYGIAWHEGQLFGLANQLVGLFTALALILLTISGIVMWWKRRPAGGGLGAPSVPDGVRLRGVAVIVLGLAAFLPMLAMSLIAVLLFDRLLRPLLRWRAQGTSA